MSKPYDPQPLLKASTYQRKLNVKVRETFDAYQIYAKLREEATNLQMLLEAAEREELMAEKRKRADQLLATLSPAELAKLKAMR